MLGSLKKTRGQKYSVAFSELQKIKELGLETLAEKKEKYHEWWDGLRGQKGVRTKSLGRPDSL